MNPNPKDVFDDPQKYWMFLTQSSDDNFEGQHFDRKEAGRKESDGLVHNAKLKNVREQITEVLSAFSNATGGLLVLGISKDGDVCGLEHLDESQSNSLLKLESLVHHSVKIRRFSCKNLAGEDRTIGLFLASEVKSAICETAGASPKAWIRQGLQNAPLTDHLRDQLKRDKGIVVFERMSAGLLHLTEVDTGVTEEFKSSNSSIANYNWPTEEFLYNIGAISKEDKLEWNNAGILFFNSNPQRVLTHAYVRLLRFEVSILERVNRPLPTFERSFSGPVTKQIRDFRTFIEESAFLKNFQRRNTQGGFTDEPEYPSIAIDEAIVNAVAHRDYAIELPILCEKYTDAILIRSPGALRQFKLIPEHFSLRDVHLEHLPRNPKLIDWLKSIKDAKGTVYVRALQEGTRQIREQMAKLDLPPPEYTVSDVSTEIVLQNDIARRTAASNNASPPISELVNLFPLRGWSLSKGDFDARRREFIQSLSSKLASAGWFIDGQRFGELTAHHQGAAIKAPGAVSSIVRLYPAYTFQVRQYHGQIYLLVDYTVQVQSVRTAEQAIADFGTRSIDGLKGYAKWRGNWERVTVLGYDNGFCRVTLPDYDLTDLVLAKAVLPKLPRHFIDQALKAAAPNYDFARELKGASLALTPAASRNRLELTQSTVDELAHTVFPLSLSFGEITISPTPTGLSSSGTAGNTLPLGSLKEPEVEFSNQHSGPDIREGITRFGGYDHNPRTVELIPICSPDQRDNMAALIDRLRSGKFKFKGAERTFSTRLTYRTILTTEGDRTLSECERLLEQYPDWVGDKSLSRLFLIYCPERGYALDDEGAPYYRIKRFLLESGIPCQMVDTPTLNNPDFKDLNLALNIVAKTGSAPWVLPESIPDADFFIGLSYTQSRRGENSRLVGFANVFNQYGRWEFFSGGSDVTSYDQRSSHYESLVRSTLGRLQLPDTPTICFHYSAKFSREDREAILRGARSVRPNGKYVFVWINTHHHVRLYDTRAESDGSAARGKYMIGGDRQIYLSTTGSNPYRKVLGTPQVLEVNVHIESSSGVVASTPDLQALGSQVLSLTKLNWASTDSLCAEPITTKYAGDIAYLTAAFIRQGGEFKIHSALERTPWFI